MPLQLSSQNFRNSLSFPIHKKQHLIHSNFIMSCSNSITSSGSISNCSYLAISTTPAVTSPTEVLIPSKTSTRVWNYFFQIPIKINSLTSCYELWVFFIAIRMVNPFQKLFQLTLLRPIKGITNYGNYSLIKMYFLNHKIWKSKWLFDSWAADWILC